MNQAKKLVLALFVTGVVLSSCSSQKSSGGHSASTTRNHKHFWQYHGK